MRFPENLIVQVRNYKELYDVSDRNYSNHRRKEEIWLEIADQVGENSDVCRETWRKLRDNYRKAKQLRKTKSAQGAKKIKPIRFEEELAFLNPHLKQAQELQTSNLSVPSSDDEDFKDNLFQQSMENFSEPTTSDSVKSVLSSSPSRLSRSTKREREYEQLSPMQEYLQLEREQQLLQQQKGHVLDMFFSSMAATVKTFPAAIQLKIKQQIFQLVTDHEAALINSESQDNAEPGPFQYDVHFETSASVPNVKRE